MKINELAHEIAQAEEAQRLIDEQCAIYEQADQLDQLRREREKRAEELETQKLQRLTELQAEMEALYVQTGDVAGELQAAVDQLRRAVDRHSEMVKERERLWKETQELARLQREIDGLYGQETNGQARWAFWRAVGGFEEKRLSVWAGLNVESRILRDYLRNAGVSGYAVRDLR